MHAHETAAPAARGDRRRRAARRASAVGHGRAAAAVGAPRLRRWVEPLPVPPVLDGRGGGKSFTIAARESTTWKFHPDLPATRTWGYWSDDPDAGLPYLGPTIEATSRPNDAVATSVTVEWRNELGNAFLPNDPTIPGAVLPGEPAPIVTHLHGGENHPQFDGTPLQWFTRTARRARTTSRTRSRTTTSSAPAWSGTTTTRSATRARTSTPGSPALYLIRDAQDTGEADNPLGLPGRPVRDPARAAGQDVQRRREHVLPDPGRDRGSPRSGCRSSSATSRSSTPRSGPVLDVEPRRYRFRIVNGSQSRFYNLSSPTSTAAGRCRSRRSGPTAGCCARPCR